VWDFETEPEYQAQLDWVRTFVEEEVEPLEHVVADPFDLTDPLRNEGVSCELSVVRGAFHGFDLVAPKAPITKNFCVQRRAALREALCQQE